MPDQHGPARPVWPFLLLAVIVITLDQVTKLAVLDHFQPGDRLTVIPGFFELGMGSQNHRAGTERTVSTKAAGLLVVRQRPGPSRARGNLFDHGRQSLAIALELRRTVGINLGLQRSGRKPVDHRDLGRRNIDPAIERSPG